MRSTLLWPEKPSSPSPSSQKRAIGELIHGRDLALQLQTLLHRGSRTNGSSSVGEIAGEILRTFTESIAALSSAVHGEVLDDGGSEESTSSKKRPPSNKDGRGCYKRRKGTETRVSFAPTVDDSYSWRKYGQKEILNAKFPRCYFRCSHKPDQDCRATKQVQKMENDPKMYQITYIGHHTCKKTLRTPQIIPDCDSYGEEMTKMPLMSSVKQELNKEDVPSDTTAVFGGPMMFGEAGDVAGCGQEIISPNNSNVDDLNDFMINFEGFDGNFEGFDGNFSFDEATTTMFSYSDHFL